MADIRAEVVNRVKVVWRRRWIALAVAWMVCAVGWTAAMLLPDEYRSEARLYVDTDTFLGPLLRNMAISNDLQHQVQVMERTMLSRPNLQRVIAATDLGLKSKTAADEQNLFDFLLRSTHINAQGPNLFVISHVDGNPALARDVVQTLINIFTESNLGQNRSEMEKARSFIDRQIASYETTLQSMERRMAEFRSKHVLELSAAGTADFGGREEAARQGVAAARREVADTETRRDSIKAQLQSIPATLELQTSPQIVVNGQLDPAKVRLSELQSQLANLKLRYTEQHPDVVATKRAIAELSAQQEGSAKSAGHGAASSPKGQVTNPVREQAELRLLDAEQGVRMAQRHLIEAEEEQKRLIAMAGSAPAIENEFNDLNRDYGVQKKQYEELLQRRESARLSEAVQNSSTKVQFRLIEPPNTPIKPSGPKRNLFFSGILLIGLAAGVGFVFVLDQIQNPVTSKEALIERFGLPVIGEISLVQAVGHQIQSRKRVIKFSLAVAMLLVVYAGLMTAVWTRYDTSRLALNLNQAFGEMNDVG